MEEHKTAVAKIAATVRDFYDKKESFRIYHGSTLSTRQVQRQRNKIVDTSMLTSVVSVDKTAKTALVEPNVAMDKLLESTTQQGLLPPVIMELPNITVGGGFAGTSGESSSFKYGYFDETVLSVQMVLGNGDVVTASRVERPDLFAGARGAMGTLGIVMVRRLSYGLCGCIVF